MSKMEEREPHHVPCETHASYTRRKLIRNGLSTSILVASSALFAMNQAPMRVEQEVPNTNTRLHERYLVSPKPIEGESVSYPLSAPTTPDYRLLSGSEY